MQSVHLDLISFFLQFSFEVDVTYVMTEKSISNFHGKMNICLGNDPVLYLCKTTDRVLQLQQGPS